jgi:hypothetical protein
MQTNLYLGLEQRFLETGEDRVRIKGPSTRTSSQQILCPIPYPILCNLNSRSEMKIERLHGPTILRQIPYPIR